jgi:concanavalin A-like lectin/glucanase superfamily protein/Big-like domain-containing protein
MNMATGQNTFTRSIFAVEVLAIILVGSSMLAFAGEPASVLSQNDDPLLPQTGYDYYSVLLGTNPIAYFHFNSMTDGSVVGGYTVSFVGNTTVGIPVAPLQEKNNKALIIPGGGGDYVTTSLMGGIPGAGSMVAWVYLSQLPSLTGRFFYVAGESQVGNDFDLQFQNDNKLYFFTGAGENTSYAPKVTKLLKKWHMIVVTYAGGANGFRNIYWDGVLVSPYTGPVSDGTKVGQFTVGYSTVFGGRDFQGNIDDVGVWNYVLSTEQIKALWQACHRKATTTTLTASPSPSNVGQPVTFTAHVTTKTGVPAPDGESVSFMKGKVLLGTGTLSGGWATFTTSSLKVGNNYIKAVYTGDATLLNSSSPAWLQQVH